MTKSKEDSIAKQKELLAQKERSQQERLHALLEKFDSIEPPARVVKRCRVNMHGRVLKSPMYGTLKGKYINPGGLPQFWVLWDDWGVELPEQVDLIEEDF